MRLEIPPDWICRRRRGTFPTKLKELIAERRKYQGLQEEGNKPFSCSDRKKIIEYEFNKLH